MAMPAGTWLALDATGLLFLSIVSVLFLGCADLQRRLSGRENDAHAHRLRGTLVLQQRARGRLHRLPAAVSGVDDAGCTSQHFGLLWVGVEATTLASAPLIYFHRQHRSLEATWKYLLICSVGIALALLGNFLLAVAASTARRA